MQKAFEKIVERLEEHLPPHSGWTKEVIEIVNQVAEEYTSTEHINCSSDSSTEEVCEWIIDKDPLGTRYTTCIGNDFIQDDPFDWEYCPYCGKKIKVIGG